MCRRCHGNGPDSGCRPPLEKFKEAVRSGEVTDDEITLLFLDLIIGELEPAADILRQHRPQVLERVEQFIRRFIFPHPGRYFDPTV